MRLLFAGTPRPPCRRWRAGGLPARGGRGAHPTGGTLRPWPHSRRVPGSRGRRRRGSRCSPRRPGEPAFLDQLTDLAPDCAPVVAYGALVPPAALVVPRHGWVNLHFSLLPAWRGAAPVQHALLAGDDVTGATTFRLEEGLDTGPVYGVVTEPIGPDDTAGDLLGRLVAEPARGCWSRPSTGSRTARCDPRRKPPTASRYAPKLNTADARVEWDAPALRVDRLVRACTPGAGRLDHAAWRAASGWARCGRPRTRPRSWPRASWR